MKTSAQLTSTLPVTSVDMSEIVCSNNKKNEKLAKSDFTKPVCTAKKCSFLIFNTRQVFTQLMQFFSRASIFQNFESKYYIRIEIIIRSYNICDVHSQITLEMGQ